MADMNDELDKVVERLLARRPDIKMLVLVGSCPSEVIKLDLSRAASRLDRLHQPRHRVMAYSGSGIETTFTQGEDNFLAELVTRMPAEKPGAAPSLIVVGAMADVVEDQMTRIFHGMGIENVAFLPSRSSESLPAIGPNTAFLMAQPWVNATALAMRSVVQGGLQHLIRWVRRPTAWLKAAAEEFRVDASRFDAITAPGRERARLAVERYREALGGKRIFLFPDSQLEPALARFLHRELGCEIIEAGTPYMHREHVAEELAQLPASATLSEGQDVDLQIDRVHESNPDLIVCGMGLGNPFEAEDAPPSGRSNSFSHPSMAMSRQATWRNCSPVPWRVAAF
ncbi:MAG: nitrogenase component 1 [Nitratireductor sp.]